MRGLLVTLLVTLVYCICAYFGICGFYVIGSGIAPWLLAVPVYFILAMPIGWLAHIWR